MNIAARVPLDARNDRRYHFPKWEAAMTRKPMKYTVTDGELVLVLEVAEEGGYVVTAPFNPHVLTQADSVEEAFEMARDLIALFEEDSAEERTGKKSGRKRAAIKKTG